MGMNPVAHLVHGFTIDISPKRFAKFVLMRELTPKEEERVDDGERDEVLEEMVKSLELELTRVQVNDGGDATFAIGGKAVTQYDWGHKEVTATPWMTIEQAERCRDLHVKLMAAEKDDWSGPPSKIAVWLCADFN